MQFLYKDDLGYHFMNSKTYEQVSLNENMINSPGLLLEGTSLIAILHYSRKMESDADEWALKKMQREGISAFGMRDFFKRIKEDNDGLESIIPD